MKGRKHLSVREWVRRYGKPQPRHNHTWETGWTIGNVEYSRCARIRCMAVRRRGRGSEMKGAWSYARLARKYRDSAKLAPVLSAAYSAERPACGGD